MDYRQVKPWKNRGIAREIVLCDQTDWQRLKSLTQRKGGTKEGTV
jgi:hypothetical protein